MAPDGKPAMTSAGCTMDMALIRELFANCMASAELLAMDADFAAKLKAATQRLVPYQIGRYGQLQEWSWTSRRVRRTTAHVAYDPFIGESIIRRHPGAGRVLRDSLATKAGGRRRLYGLEPRLGDRFWAGCEMERRRLNRSRSDAAQHQHEPV